MSIRTIYELLEAKMLNYSDYADVPVRDVGESFAAIQSGRNLMARQMDAAMLDYVGQKVYVRKGVLERLRQAARELAKYDKSLRLEVVYGYRALEIQKKMFAKYKKQLENQYSGKELLVAVHRLVAVPEVAGHPAGAAVDIQIIKNGKPLDFGTKVHEFVQDSFTFSPFISAEAWQNRQLLRRVMMGAGFAPFDGEWWHFSYGDKEWARYYSRSKALYKQIDWSIT